MITEKVLSKELWNDTNLHATPLRFLKKPDYVVRKTEEPNTEPEKFSCPCCSSEMKPEQLLEKSTVYRCTGCGISDTKLNS